VAPRRAWKRMSSAWAPYEIVVQSLSSVKRPFPSVSTAHLLARISPPMPTSDVAEAIRY
jgi:hypothetical protein